MGDNPPTIYIVVIEVTRHLADAAGAESLGGSHCCRRYRRLCHARFEALVPPNYLRRRAYAASSTAAAMAPSATPGPSNAAGRARRN